MTLGHWLLLDPGFRGPWEESEKTGLRGTPRRLLFPLFTAKQDQSYSWHPALKAASTGIPLPAHETDAVALPSQTINMISSSEVPMVHVSSSFKLSLQRSNPYGPRALEKQSANTKVDPPVQSGAHPLCFREDLVPPCLCLHVCRWLRVWFFSMRDTEPGSGSQLVIVGFGDAQLTWRHLEESFRLWISSSSLSVDLVAHI